MKILAKINKSYLFLSKFTYLIAHLLMKQNFESYSWYFNYLLLIQSSSKLKLKHSYWNLFNANLAYQKSFNSKIITIRFAKMRGIMFYLKLNYEKKDLKSKIRHHKTKLWRWSYDYNAAIKISQNNHNA